MTTDALPRAGHRKSDLLWLLVGAFLYIAIQVVYANGQRHDNDFKHIYLGTLAILDGDSPYPPESLLLHASRRDMRNVALNPYVYPPFTGLSLGFLGPLSFRAASQLWFGLNHVFTLAALWLIAATLWPSRRIAAFGGLMAALALNHPLTRSLTAGQLNHVLLLCVAGSYAALARGREVLAGLILGYGALFKLAPAVFGLWFLIQRRWRALVAMAATVLLLLVLSVLAVGWKMNAEFLPMLADMRYGRSTWQHIRADGGGATFWKDPPNQSPNSLMTHLLVADNGVTEPWAPLTQTTANAATWGITLVLLGAYLWAGGVAQVRKPRTSAGLFHATLLLSLLIPSLMWDHYLMATILPVAWLVHRYMDQWRPGALAALVVVYILISIPWNFFSPAFRQGLSVPLMSMKLFPTMVLYFMVCIETRREASSGTCVADGTQQIWRNQQPNA